MVIHGKNQMFVLIYPTDKAMGIKMVNFWAKKGVCSIKQAKKLLWEDNQLKTTYEIFNSIMDLNPENFHLNFHCIFSEHDLMRRYVDYKNHVFEYRRASH